MNIRSEPRKVRATHWGAGGGGVGEEAAFWLAGVHIRLEETSAGIGFKDLQS